MWSDDLNEAWRGRGPEERGDLAPDLLRPTVQVYKWGGGRCMRGWNSTVEPWCCPRERSEVVCSW